jgi:dihydromonapterin reductase / dihydrofolate reductase
MELQMEVEQKPCVLVTGASRRLGANLVKHWLNSGYQVLATYRHESASVNELRQLGAKMLCADVASEQGVSALILQVQQHTQTLRAIVHNASVWHSDDELVHAPELLSATFALHLFSPYRLNVALLPLLKANVGIADIVLISDASCDRGKADKALYTASKSAMESLMRSQAIAFAPKVKVNAVAPGLLAFHESDSADYRQQRLEQSLLGIEPGFQPAIQAIDYLLANPYNTGMRLVVDGGAGLKSC